MIICPNPVTDPIVAYATYYMAKMKVEKELKAAVKRGDIEQAQKLLIMLEQLKFRWPVQILGPIY